MRRLLFVCLICAMAMPLSACGKKPKFLEVPPSTLEQQQRQTN